MMRVLFVLGLLSVVACGISIPNAQPIGYVPGQIVSVRVSSLTSTHEMLPFPFYSVPQCKPLPSRFKAEKKKQNLGESLTGIQNEPSEYFVEIMRNISCRKVCDTMSIDDKQKSALKSRIDQRYRGHMSLDGLDVAQLPQISKGVRQVTPGYPLGVPAKLSPSGKALVNNHLHFEILFNEPDVHSDNNEETYRIVGFHVKAYSVKYDHVDSECDIAKDFSLGTHEMVSIDDEELTYTYSVSWIPEPNVAWATRWDEYFRGTPTDNRIHWFSILNSTIVVITLAIFIGLSIIRSLRKDISRYNVVTAEEVQEESGWKMCHGDVFRAPEQSVLFTVIVSTGFQLVLMTASTLAIALLGFLNPQSRGSLLSALISCYVFAGFFAGVLGARLLKYFNNQSWRNAFAIGIFLPGVSMSWYILLNFIQWGAHASSAVPITTLLSLFCLWLCCSIPLTVMGAQVGFRQGAIRDPCRVHGVARLIPATKGSVPLWATPLIAGAVPFGAGFIELLFVLTSVWQGRIYYAFGFLSVALVIVTLCAAEASIALTYFRLTGENYHWWWPSLFSGFSTGLFVFLYTVYFLLTSLSIRHIPSVLLYFGYMGMASAIVGIMMGSVAFIASYLFIRKIYSSIKVD